MHLLLIKQIKIKNYYNNNKHLRKVNAEVLKKEEI